MQRSTSITGDFVRLILHEITRERGNPHSDSLKIHEDDQPRYSVDQSLDLKHSRQRSQSPKKNQ